MTSHPIIECPGDVVTIDKITIPRAASLANLLSTESIQFASLIECRQNSNGQIIVFEVEVEIPQLRKYDIKRRETIAAVFTVQDEKAPEVLALRKDFPKVPHLNLGDDEFPRSLCLYEELWRDLKSRWTSPLFVERIREWLALTAKGILHQEDQPLEPIIHGVAGTILLPYDLILKEEKESADHLFLYPTDPSFRFLIAGSKQPRQREALEISASVHYLPPTQHGIIHHKPHSLAELARLVDNEGFDLIKELRKKLTIWLNDNILTDKTYQSPLALILIAPKTRNKDAPPETCDTLVFITGATLKQVGLEIDVWEPQPQNNKLGLVVFPAPDKDGKNVAIDFLNPCFELTRKLASQLNGIPEPDNISLVGIGVGALGSQIVMHLARSGFGQWILIDDDRLMPHNIPRHALNPFNVGYNKAQVLTHFANLIASDQDLFQDIPADILSPGEHAETVNNALTGCDVILDMSASVSVARHIALGIESQAKRASAFLTPTGDDLVIIVEDSNRCTRLDELEMQYYRAVVNDHRLEGHIKPPEGRRRYGQSCRDITSTLPQHLVGLHSSIASRSLQDSLRSDKSLIKIWRADRDSNVSHINVETRKSVRHNISGWSVCTDLGLIDKLSNLRKQKLPKETGGVLIGSFDIFRRIIYIVDTISSPPDSREWPTWYIRGKSGLKKQIAEIANDTDGILNYIGEWHSHPDNASTRPSLDDQNLFSWIKKLMSRDGLPALMLIVGGKNKVSCFVEEIGRRNNLLPI